MPCTIQTKLTPVFNWHCLLCISRAEHQLQWRQKECDHLNQLLLQQQEVAAELRMEVAQLKAANNSSPGRNARASSAGNAAAGAPSDEGSGSREKAGQGGASMACPAPSDSPTAGAAAVAETEALLRKQLAEAQAALAAAEAHLAELRMQLQQQMQATAAAGSQLQVAQSREQQVVGEVEQLKQQLQQQATQMQQQDRELQLLGADKQVLAKQLQHAMVEAEEQQQLMHKVEEGKRVIEQELASIQEQLVITKEEVAVLQSELKQYAAVGEMLTEMCSRDQPQRQEQGAQSPEAAAGSAASGGKIPNRPASGEAASVAVRESPAALCDAGTLARLVQQLQQMLASKQQQLEQLSHTEQQHQREMKSLKQQLQEGMQHIQAVELQRQGVELQLLKLQHQQALQQQQQHQKHEPRADGTALLLQNLLALITLMEKLYGLQQAGCKQGIPASEAAETEAYHPVHSAGESSNKANAAVADAGPVAESIAGGSGSEAANQQLEPLQVLGGGRRLGMRYLNARSSISSLPGTCTPSTPQKPRDAGLVGAVPAGGARAGAGEGSNWLQQQQAGQGGHGANQHACGSGGRDGQQEGTNFSFRSLLGAFSSSAGATGPGGNQIGCAAGASVSSECGSGKGDTGQQQQQQQQAAELLRQLQQRLLQLSQDLSGAEEMLLHQHAEVQPCRKTSGREQEQQQPGQHGPQETVDGDMQQLEDQGMLTPPPLHAQPQQQEGGMSGRSGSEPPSSGALSSEEKAPDSDSSGSSSRSWRALQAALTQLEQQVQQQQEMICSMKGVQPQQQSEVELQLLPLQFLPTQSQQQQQQESSVSGQEVQQGLGQGGVEWQQVEQQAQHHRLLLEHLQMLLRQVSSETGKREGQVCCWAEIEWPARFVVLKMQAPGSYCWFEQVSKVLCILAGL